MSDVPALLEHRRSIRRYTGEPIPEADIRRLAELAGRAPSAWNVQPWRFVAVRDPEVKQRLMAAANNQPQVGAAAVVFVLTSDMADVVEHAEELGNPVLPEEKRAGLAGLVRRVFGERPDREAWGAGQAYIALGYLLIAAESMGYGTSPMLGFDPVAVRALLGLADHVAIPAIVAIGRPAEDGLPPHRHPVDRILRIV